MTELQTSVQDELYIVRDATAGNDKRFINSAFYGRARTFELADSASATALHRKLLSAIIRENEGKIDQLRYPNNIKHHIHMEFRRINDEAQHKPDSCFTVERYSLRCDYRIGCFARVPAGVEHLEIGGIPRSLLYRGDLRQASSFTKCMFLVRHRLPFYNIHLWHGIKKWSPKIGQCYKVESGLIKRIPRHDQTT